MQADFDETICKKNIEDRIKWVAENLDDLGSGGFNSVHIDDLTNLDSSEDWISILRIIHPIIIEKRDLFCAECDLLLKLNFESKKEILIRNPNIDIIDNKYLSVFEPPEYFFYPTKIRESFLTNCKEINFELTSKFNFLNSDESYYSYETSDSENDGIWEGKLYLRYFGAT